jgi:SagB-type dehydrogenase family enzyme
VSNAFEQLTAHVSASDFSSLSDVPNPSFYVLYCVNLKKSIFKYRTRGYRLSLLEVGSMYQNMLSCAQSAGVSSRVLSGFPERQIAHMCHLDGRLLLPTIVQAFGFEKKQDDNPA